MKIRNGFVSNSSSSSFIILKENLTPKQIEKIKNHTYHAYRLEGLRPPNKKGEFISNRFGYADDWNITEDNLKIEGYTHMDNFDMEMFLGEIGVNSNVVGWSD